jgi:hypothetical protein
MMGKQIPDTSETESDTKPKTRNRKGFREPTSLHVDPKLWQEVRVMAVLKGVSLAEYFEDALRRKIDADNKEAGKEGYRVGQGGMYIPPPPQPTQEKQKQKYSDIFNKDTIDGLVEGEGELRLHMPGLEFPTNKNKLIQIAKEHDENLEDYQIDIDSYLPIIEKLPDKNKKYNNVSELGEAIKEVVNANEELMSVAKETFEINKTVSCVIDTRHAGKKQQERLKVS